MQKARCHVLSCPVLSVASVLGGSEFMDVLCDMKTGSPELNGSTFFSDPRLVANGFQIRLSPGMFQNRDMIHFSSSFSSCGQLSMMTPRFINV